MRPLARLLLTFLLALAVCSSAASQSARKPPTNVLAGTLTKLDLDEATVVVKSKSGAETTYRLTEKTQVWRGKKAVEAHLFTPGEAVVVRFRKSSVGPASLYDFADAASWKWIDRLRHETTAVTLKEVEEGSLTAEADGGELIYRVTEKTQWSRGGKPASPSDYKAGDHAFIIPRLLPGGATMATAVTDAVTDAAKLKERGRYTLSGVIRVLNVEKRTLNVHSAAGDDRLLSVTGDCVIRRSGKDVSFASLRPGINVTLHLTRDESGEQVVKQITIKSATARKPAPKSLPKPTHKPA
jgi:hypothetical protein